MSRAAINDAQSFLQIVETRRHELWSRYHLTMKQFERLRQTCGTALYSLTFIPQPRAEPRPTGGCLRNGGPKFLGAPQATQHLQQRFLMDLAEAYKASYPI